MFYKIIDMKSIYPVKFNGKFWKKEDCADVFVCFYHCRESLDWQTSVYISEGSRMQPDGTWVD